ncbi:lactaldehyde reductase [Bacteroides reticulotermitis JCM 10512]|uniref:Lactaldehyde reductase n=1 Tax=Bacteroides reticulotermitis JCM 10512 TaxID=1445607 RepID=W4UUG2_9BACE|nr:lactaldehyde reductase [Bacteroides reticulotermitis JCM 10512]
MCKENVTAVFKTHVILMNRIILNETSYFGAGCRSVIAVEASRRGFKKAFL